MKLTVLIFSFFKKYVSERKKLNKLDDFTLLNIFIDDHDSFIAAVADNILKKRGWDHDSIRRYRKNNKGLGKVRTSP